MPSLGDDPSSPAFVASWHAPGLTPYCEKGTDCSDCSEDNNLRCDDTCQFARDGSCDEPDFETYVYQTGFVKDDRGSRCEPGTDCTDCVDQSEPIWGPYKEWGEPADVILVDLTSFESESNDSFKLPLRTKRKPDLEARGSSIQPGGRVYDRCVLSMLLVICFICMLVDLNRYCAVRDHTARDHTARDVDPRASYALRFVV